MSDHDHTVLGPEEEELLKISLTSAFTTPPSDIKRNVPVYPKTSTAEASTSATSAPTSEPTPPVPTNTTDSDTQSTTLTDSWQQEYDSLLQSWQSESSAQRTKAEETRAKWEAIRASERKDRGGLTDLEMSVSGVRGPPNPRFEETSVKDKDEVKVGGEVVPEVEAEAEVEEVEGEKNTDDHNDSDTHPLGESYTTVSYPETSPESELIQPSLSPSLSSHEKALAPTNNSPSTPNPPRPPPPPAGTLALFDSSLPLSTRALGLLSSLTINLLLPFVNGVMLGFGEIFARNVVLRFGWKVPGRFGSSNAGTSGVGLRTAK